jgi:beta-glucosidase
MGEAITRGYQGSKLSDPQRVAACLKHFMGYGIPLSGKDRTPAYIPDRLLREVVMPPFQRAIEAGAATVMICSGEINGIPVHADKRILTDILRGEMGFQGLAVSDWEDIRYLYTRHRVAADYKEAIKLSINAGVDMSMVPTDLEFPRLLRELVEEGQVPMARIDEAVRRILRLKLQLGLFENPYPPKEEDSLFGSEGHATASRMAAAESITLLKNDTGRLPLTPGTRLLVTGPTAHSLNYLNGGWTGTWQGDDPKYNTPGKQTILEALRAAAGEAQVAYAPGAAINELLDVEAAVAAAADVDVIIACLGEATYTEKPGDIDDLDLPEAQQELVKALAATGKPLVLVLAQGRPRVIREIEPLAEAILMAYLPGNEGAPALADILYGAVNPSGKLPFTYPRYGNDLVTYDHKATEAFSRNFDFNAFNPQYPFGFGLSYTNFFYESLELSSDTLSADGVLSVSIAITNGGEVDGMEVAQLYTTDEVASISPSVRRLRAFEKVFIAAGDRVEVSFELRAADLAFVGQDDRWTTEPGWFTVSIGGEKARFYYRGK